MISAPNKHVHDRREIDAMALEWMMKNGSPRRFAQGFSGEWICIRTLLASLGYELRFKPKAYTIKRIGAPGRPKRMGREEALRRIDEILVEHGREPFVRREAA